MRQTTIELDLTDNTVQVESSAAVGGGRISLDFTSDAINVDIGNEVLDVHAPLAPVVTIGAVVGPRGSQGDIGPQGIPGPPGPPGDSVEAMQATWVQGSPSAVWDCFINLLFKPAGVKVYDSGGTEHVPEVIEYVAVGHVRLFFRFAFGGTAEFS